MGKATLLSNYQSIMERINVSIDECIQHLESSKQEIYYETNGFRRTRIIEGVFDTVINYISTIEDIGQIIMREILKIYTSVFREYRKVTGKSKK